MKTLRFYHILQVEQNEIFKDFLWMVTIITEVNAAVIW